MSCTGPDGAVAFYVVKCRQGDHASIARRAGATETLRVIKQTLGQGWTLAEITRYRWVIDKAALQHREMAGA